MNDLISVIVPCFRQAHFLKECLASLQAQTYPNWEAIVVDDGSPDDAAAVAIALAQSDPRIRLVRKVNGGLSSARNAGLAAARGGWIQFLDSDDVLMPRKLELQLQCMQGAPALVFSYTDYWHGAEDNPLRPVDAGRLSCRFTAPDPLFDLAWRWEIDFSIPIHTALFDATFFRDCGLRFDEGLPNHEDWDMWMQVVGLATEIHFVDAALASYRFSQGSMSRDREPMWRGFRAAVEKQRIMNQHRPVVARMLKSKLAIIDSAYGKGWRAGVRSLMAKSTTYRKVMPWKLQAVLTHLLGPSTAVWAHWGAAKPEDSLDIDGRQAGTGRCRVLVHPVADVAPTT